MRAALAAGLLCACASVPPSLSGTETADSLTPWLDAARAEVQAALDELVDARRRHDIEAAMALRAEDVTLVRADGTRFDRAALDALVRDADSRLLEIGPESGVTIDRIEDWSPQRPWASDEPALLVVRVTQRFVRDVVDPATGLPATIDTTAPYRETWRRTPDGWRQVEVMELAE